MWVALVIMLPSCTGYLLYYGIIIIFIGLYLMLSDVYTTSLGYAIKSIVPALYTDGKIQKAVIF